MSAAYTLPMLQIISFPHVIHSWVYLEVKSACVWTLHSLAHYIAHINFGKSLRNKCKQLFIHFGHYLDAPLSVHINT